MRFDYRKEADAWMNYWMNFEEDAVILHLCLVGWRVPLCGSAGVTVELLVWLAATVQWNKICHHPFPVWEAV